MLENLGRAKNCAQTTISKVVVACLPLHCDRREHVERDGDAAAPRGNRRDAPGKAESAFGACAFSGES